MEKKGLLLVAIAFELAGLIIAFVYLGKYVDEKMNLKGLGTAGGAFLGLAIWVAHVIFVLREKEGDQK